MADTKTNTEEKKETHQYTKIFQNALKRYINQDRLTHHTIQNTEQNPYYTPSLFTSMRHSQSKYPALEILEKNLNEAKTETAAQNIIIQHFSDDANKWHHHSFNSYFLDELFKQDKKNWESLWMVFDPRPIVYYKGLLFRGTWVNPKTAFSSGLAANNFSPNLTDYITKMSGAIGVSTTTEFRIAENYALPKMLISPTSNYSDYQEWWLDSHIYVIDYQDIYGINIDATFNARCMLPENSHDITKHEVNTIQSIRNTDIIGAFYVHRDGTIIWYQNPNYTGNLDFRNQIPATYQKCLDEKQVKSATITSISSRSIISATESKVTESKVADELKTLLTRHPRINLEHLDQDLTIYQEQYNNLFTFQKQLFAKTTTELFSIPLKEYILMINSLNINLSAKKALLAEYRLAYKEQTKGSTGAWDSFLRVISVTDNDYYRKQFKTHLLRVIEGQLGTVEFQLGGLKQVQYLTTKNKAQEFKLSVT